MLFVPESAANRKIDINRDVLPMLCSAAMIIKSDFCNPPDLLSNWSNPVGVPVNDVWPERLRFTCWCTPVKPSFSVYMLSEDCRNIPDRDSTAFVCTCSISSSSEAECFRRNKPISLNLRCTLKSNKRFTYWLKSSVMPSRCFNNSATLKDIPILSRHPFIAIGSGWSPRDIIVRIARNMLRLNSS